MTGSHDTNDETTRRNVLRKGAVTAGALAVGGAASTGAASAKSNSDQQSPNEIKGEVDGTVKTNAPFTVSGKGGEYRSQTCTSGQNSKTMFWLYSVQYCSSQSGQPLSNNSGSSSATLYVPANGPQPMPGQTYKITKVEKCPKSDNKAVTVTTSKKNCQ